MDDEVAGVEQPLEVAPGQNRSGPSAQSGPSSGPAPTGLVRQVLAWGPVAIMALAPVALVGRTTVPVRDPDTFWHIVAGKHLWTTHQFSGDAPWPPSATQPWLLHEWLPELWFAAADTIGGLRAVAFLQGVLALALLLTLYACARRVARPLPAAMAVLAAWVGVSASVSARPQMVTFALLAVTTTTWLRTARDGRVRWWLIALSYVWACSHGLWISGVLVGGAVVLGMALERGRSLRELAALAAVPLLSAVGGLLTPVGPGLLLATSEIGKTTRYVAEWSPASLQDPNLAATVAMAGVVVLVWARRTTPVPWSHVAVWALALAWALMYGRTVALGAVMLLPLVASSLEGLLPRPSGTGVPRRRERLVVGAGFGLAVLLSALVATGTSSAPADVPSSMDPVLADLPRGSVVFNDYALGGWLLYDHPNIAAVIDGRTELFRAEYVGSYMAALGATPGWDRTVRQTGARWALLPDDNALAGALQGQLRWTVVVRGDGYVLLAAP